MSSGLASSFSSNKERLSPFLTGRKKCTALRRTVEQKKAQGQLLLCDCGMWCGNVYVCECLSSALPPHVCVCIQSRVSSHAWRRGLLILEFPVKMLIWDPPYMCSFWVNWLKMPFSPGQSLFILLLLSGHTLRPELLWTAEGETRTRVETQLPSSHTSDHTSCYV